MSKTEKHIEYHTFTGKKKIEGTIKDGKRDGLWTEWHENGMKKRETTYKDGKEDGLVKSWWSNRGLKEKIYYEDGKVFWDEYWDIDGVYGGKIERDETWDSGAHLDERRG